MRRNAAESAAPETLRSSLATVGERHGSRAAMMTEGCHKIRGYITLDSGNTG